ncbi:MAG: ABC transporter ATP-binding protein, partial [Planctomycetota bacterium]
MSQPTDERPALRPRLQAAVRTLELLAKASGSTANPVELADRLAEAAPPGDASIGSAEWIDWLARAARDLGLRTKLATARPSAVLEIVRSGVPLATSCPQGKRWMVLEGGKGDQVVAREITNDEAGVPDDSERAVDPATVDEMLREGDEDARIWIVTDPATPHESAVSDAASGKALTPVRRVRALLAPERGEIWAVVVFAVTIGVLSIATPVAVQAIVNSIALGGLLQLLVVVAILLAFALGFVAFMTAVQTWIVELIQRRLFLRTMADVAARLPRVSTEALASGHGPELVNRFFDVVTVQKAASKLLIEALGTVLTIGAGLAVLAFYHPLLLAFDVVLIFATGLIVLAPLRRGQATAIQESTAKYAVVGWLEEIARNPNTFRAAGSEQWIYQRSDALGRTWLESRRRHFRTLFGQMIGGLALQVVASAALLTLGSLLVMQNSLTLGQLVAAELIVTTVVAGVAKLGRHLETWYDLTSGAFKLGKLLDVPLHEMQGEHPPRSVVPGARLDFVGLGWNGPRGRGGASGVNATVEPGTSLGVLASSGSRASLAALLGRLRDPGEGSLRLDGRAYRDLARDAIQREVAVVDDAEVVRGTVRENVRLFRPHVSRDDVRRAIQLVGLERAVSELEGGLEAELHPATEVLSPDELVRLSVARALAGKPRLLVLGAALDRLPPLARTEMLAASALDDGSGPTVVLLTEDEAFASRCDSVLRLDAG